MEAGTRGGAPSTFTRFSIDAIEGINQIQDAHFQAGLFQQLAGYTVLQRFAEFQRSAGDGPLPQKRLGTAPNQENTVVFDDHSTNTNDRTIWIFTRHCGLSFVVKDELH